MAIQLTTTEIPYDHTKPVKETFRAAGKAMAVGLGTATKLLESTYLITDIVYMNIATTHMEEKKEFMLRIHQLELEYQQTLASLQA